MGIKVEMEGANWGGGACTSWSFRGFGMERRYELDALGKGEGRRRRENECLRFYVDEKVSAIPSEENVWC